MGQLIKQLETQVEADTTVLKAKKRDIEYLEKKISEYHNAIKLLKKNYTS